MPSLAYLYDGYTLGTSSSTTIVTYANKDLKPKQSVSYEFSIILDAEPAMLILTGFYTDFNNKISGIAGINVDQTINGMTCDAVSTNQCTFYRNLTPTSAVQQSSLATNARGLVGKYYKNYQLVDIAATYKFDKIMPLHLLSIISLM